jgi:uncharacterized protein YaiI (UPF0178 family)
MLHQQVSVLSSDVVMLPLLATYVATNYLLSLAKKIGDVILGEKRMYEVVVTRDFQLQSAILQQHVCHPVLPVQ